MNNFRDRAKDAMETAREKAADAMDTAVDIARDQLDTFKKLSKQGQEIVLAVLVVILVVILTWLFWPHNMDVTVEMVVEPTAGNSIAITNYEKKDLGQTTVIINDIYEATLQGLPPGQTTSISVLDFHQGGKPGGAAPGKNMLPKIITVRSGQGTKTRKFKR